MDLHVLLKKNYILTTEVTAVRLDTAVASNVNPE